MVDEQTSNRGQRCGRVLSVTCGVLALGLMYFAYESFDASLHVADLATQNEMLDHDLRISVRVLNRLIEDSSVEARSETLAELRAAKFQRLTFCERAEGAWLESLDWMELTAPECEASSARDSGVRTGI